MDGAGAAIVTSLRLPAERVLRVVVVGPQGVGGQAHAARDILAGFSSHASVHVEFQAIDPRLSGPWRFLTEWKFLRSIVRPVLYCRGLIAHAARADVLHVFAAAHTAFLFGALPALMIAAWFRRPVILNYRDGRAEAHFRWWGPLLHWVLLRGPLLVFPSTYLQEVFGRHGLHGVVVPNVVDTSAFTYHGPDSPVRTRLVSARALEALYGTDNTLRAFALIKAEVPDASLDIYGTGSATRSLRRAAAAQGTSDIRFHGAVSRKEMPAVLGDGGILVNSSRIDNMPHLLIEAFAAGLPIVSTAAGGIPHIVTHERTGLLVAVDRPEELAAAVLRVLREPGLAQRLASNGRRECGRYSWPEAEKGWLEVYRRVAAEYAATRYDRVIGLRRWSKS